MRDILAFLGIGKLFIYLIQKSPIPRFVPTETLKDLFGCDLCLGFWVYLVLGVMLKVDIDENIKNKIISKFATAGFSTFILHLISIGWREKFSTYVYYADNN